MSRRAWPNPVGPTGRQIELVNPTNAPETGTEIWVHETPLPVAIMGRFFEFLSGVSRNRLSNGQLTTIPVLSRSEISKFMTPYNDWAPPPYNNNDIRADTAANRFSMLFTGLPDMLDIAAIFSGDSFVEPTKIDFELEICRQRIWAGMVPLSDRRWAEKKLDSPENIDLAVEYVLKTCDMVYFSLPATQRRMRQDFNKGHDILAHFDMVLDAYYTAHPETTRPTPVARTADLWTEFFFCHVKFITTRIHTWAATHLNRLADGILQRIQSAPTLPDATRMSPQQDALFTQFERLCIIIRRIDECLLFPLVGFKNNLPHWRHASSPPIVNWPQYIRSHGATALAGSYPIDITQRDEVYHQRLAHLVRQELTRQRAERNIDAITAAGNIGAFSEEEAAAPVKGVMTAYALGRRELRGEPEAISEELWIGALRRCLEPRSDSSSAAIPKWGFVAYRLWFGHSDEQWDLFMRKFTAGVNNWGAGVAGADLVRGSMEIRWVDGRDHGLKEGDVEGARKHFQVLQENSEVGILGLNAPGFLVADEACIDSYIHSFTLPGQSLLDEADMGPFIQVGRETVDGSGRQAPGFEGTVRVLGSVLLDDVWPCLWWRHVNVEDLWNLATLHPSCVYVGPVVQSQLKGWSKFHGIREELIRKADQWKREGRLP
ncbi:hypothetical protein QBC47DRAFT_371069 [Echria macrotheca]|uniref:Uncharacterized protein n=1 Tax=Echria macrotheca TaxID=438768 RepID=A0AAJ0F9H8_9PEZI|nr:hypothetical protein QBC47DRAFT_371069 [Echria macrotheca]